MCPSVRGWKGTMEGVVMDEVLEKNDRMCFIQTAILSGKTSTGLILVESQPPTRHNMFEHKTKVHLIFILGN